LVAAIRSTPTDEVIRDGGALLGRILKATRALASVAPLAKDASPDVRCAVSYALGMISEEDRATALNLLQQLVRDRSVEVREAAASALACSGGDAARIILGDALETETDELVREAIESALSEFE
jgi:HEAT repeat protein